MPTVPRLEPQIKEADLPSVRVDSAPAARAAESAGLSDQAFGAIEGAARGVQKSFDLNAEIARKEREKANTAWSQGLDDQALTEKKRMLYDPENGVFNVGKGENAMPVTAAARVNYRKYLQSLAESATNDEQKEMAKRILTKRYNDMDVDLLQHETAEQQAMAKQKHESLVNTYRDEAVLNYRNPQRVADTLAHQEAAIKTYLTQNGIKGEVADREAQVERSKTLSAIVNRYIVNGQDLQAKAFYQANKDGFTGSDIDNVEKSLEAGNHQGEVYRNKDRIMKNYADLETRRAAAAEIADPKVRKDVDAELIREDELEKKNEKLNRDQIFIEAYNQLDEAGGDMTKVSSELKRNLLPSQMHALEVAAYGRAEAKRRAEDRAQRATEHAQNLKEHAQDRAIRLQEHADRMQEHAQDRADRIATRQARAERDAAKALDAKEKADAEFQQDDRVYVHYYGMEDKDLAKVPEAELLEKVNPFVTDESFQRILTKWSHAREEAGKPPKSVQSARAKAILNRRNGTTKVEVFKPMKDNNYLIAKLKALPSSGITDADTNSEIAKSEQKARALRVFEDNVNQEMKTFYDQNARNPTYQEREQLVSRLITQSVFEKKKRFGLDFLAKDEEKPIGLVPREDTTAYTPFNQIVPSARQKFLDIADHYKTFEPGLSVEKKQARIERAHAAAKRGASAATIIDILKKDE